MAAALAREVHALDPNLALDEVITLQEQLDRSTSAQLVALTLVSFCIESQNNRIKTGVRAFFQLDFH
jgi:hypothetical protein